ncbi:MAG: DUF6111 family protein [Geminicoccaceae bacterium]|nr:DUF6111 family protein [Geminicoccaceae bacterium]MCS7269178.1 DUF6111 family protein [Geminicoccaceae bacterium]MCX7629838.1 DUF6111 family protein [Geminicoccaceae bacterium]MDW8125733.1 DUF6111 family protein [Geminicoccaceae bacterium]MDW8340756.1 DUF6111 family protein [Geminicoccaceae bacterium]
MLRIALVEILLFLAPFALYALWRLLVTKGARLLADTPWFLLMVSGLLAACAGLVLLLWLEPGAPPGSVYVPPRLEDGRLVPGEFRRVP